MEKPLVVPEPPTRCNSVLREALRMVMSVLLVAPRAEVEAALYWCQSEVNKVC